MKQRVVFLFYHGFGHINAVLKIAAILRSENYDVYFAGAGFFQQYVITQGFKFYLLKTTPFGYGFETWINTVSNAKHVYLSTLKDRITDKLSKRREVELYWMLEELKPSVVLIDSRQATDFIVMYAHLKARGVKAAMVHVMLPFEVLPGRPPLNSEVFSNDKKAVTKATHLLRWKQLKKVWKKKLMYLGFDDRYIIRRKIRKASLPKYFISKATSLVNFSVENIDEFIFTPREFEFPEFKPKSNQHYIGFMTYETRHDALEPEYQNLSSHVLALKKEKNLKFIYCSFGTVELKKKHVIFSFLTKLIHVAKDGNHILLISLKAPQADIDTLTLTENIFIFPSVPQLEVLKYTDLFITHGGMNSIKEAVHNEVPMLLYPIHEEFDPIGNAARIAYYGWGLRGRAARDSRDEIKKKINDLLQNPKYKKNIKDLKNKDASYTEENFLEKFNAIKTL